MDENVLRMLGNFLRFYIGSCVLFVLLLVKVQEELLENRRLLRNRKRKRYSITRELTFHSQFVSRMVAANDIECINSFRMDTNTFKKLLFLLRTSGGLEPTLRVSVEEQLAIFLTVISHHIKLRVIGVHYKRSIETVHNCVHNVLYSIMKINKVFYPKLNPVDDNCDVYNWSCFKGCIGALDGTYMPVHVPKIDNVRYHSRKGGVSTNVLAACDINMLFTYTLVGWEGSAADGRVVRDAITRPGGLKVPAGTYYLVDCGYTNGEGFLAPYRGVRYHLKEWENAGGQHTPQNPREYFNMRHSRARNVIERTFGNLKRRWAILRSPSFYPVETQLDLQLACMLLNNFIRMHMSADYLDDDDFSDTPDPLQAHDNIEIIEASDEWSNFRDMLAQNMYNEWLERRGLGFNGA